MDDGYTAEDFCNCHEDFCNNLAAYLIEQEQRLNYAELNDTLASGFANGIQNYKRGFREAEATHITNAEKRDEEFIFNFISFNYTSVLERCMDAVSKKDVSLGAKRINGFVRRNQFGKVLHIHGTVFEDMVLGLNDVSQISAMQLFEGCDEEYTNQLIKQKTNETNQHNSYEKAYELLKASHLIYIYGMSTGETDKLWWERICDLMANNTYLHLMIHKFDAPEDGLIRRKYIQYVKHKQREFVSYSNLDDAQKEAIMQRIHIDRTNIFSDLHDLVNNSANVQEAKEPALSN